MTGIPPAVRRGTRKPARGEEKLQVQITQYLRWALPPEVWFAHVPNGGYRSKTEGARLKAMGVKPGCPDLLIVHAGRAHWIELKIEDRNPTLVQAICHRELREAGCTVSTARSLDRVIAVLTELGVPLRESHPVSAAIRRSFGGLNG